MTKEQEVIKYIETRIKICNENADICDDNDFDEEATYLREESYMLETALNMLKDLQRENKYMHSELDRQQTTINNYAKEIEKKDKQIDLMLDKIDMTKSSPCTMTNEYSIGRVYMSKEEKKQYFEKLAKEKGE